MQAGRDNATSSYICGCAEYLLHYQVGFNRNFNYNAFWTQVTSGREIVAAIAYGIE